MDSSLRLIEGGFELHAVTAVRQQWYSGLAAVAAVHTGNCTEGMSNLCVLYSVRHTKANSDAPCTQSVCCIAVTDG